MRESTSRLWDKSAMPIYEFSCPKCRRIYSFLSKRVNPDHLPVCPKCGNRKLSKQLSRFAMTRGLKGAPAPAPDEAGGSPRPGIEDSQVERAMLDMERDLEGLDENNPKHMAHMMKKMKDLMPPGSLPKELDVAIKRLEAGEDPEEIEADMGDVLDDFTGGPEGGGGAAVVIRRMTVFMTTEQSAFQEWMAEGRTQRKLGLAT